MQVFVSSSFILLIGNFVPIPGGSVGIEGAYLLFFEKFLPSAALNASLIIWRGITYYFGIIHFEFININDIIRHIVIILYPIIFV